MVSLVQPWAARTETAESVTGVSVRKGGGVLIKSEVVGVNDAIGVDELDLIPLKERLKMIVGSKVESSSCVIERDGKGVLMSAMPSNVRVRREEDDCSSQAALCSSKEEMVGRLTTEQGHEDGVGETKVAELANIAKVDDGIVQPCSSIANEQKTHANDSRCSSQITCPEVQVDFSGSRKVEADDHNSPKHPIHSTFSVRVECGSVAQVHEECRVKNETNGELGTDELDHIPLKERYRMLISRISVETIEQSAFLTGDVHQHDSGDGKEESHYVDKQFPMAENDIHSHNVKLFGSPASDPSNMAGASSVSSYSSLNDSNSRESLSPKACSLGGFRESPKECSSEISATKLESKVEHGFMPSNCNNMLDAALPAIPGKVKVENLEDGLDCPNENQNAMCMLNMLDPALPAVPVKVKVENLEDGLDCPSENQNAMHMLNMLDAALPSVPVEEKVENLEDELGCPSEKQNAVHMHNKLDAGLLAVPVKVKVENFEYGLYCPSENQNAMHMLNMLDAALPAVPVEEKVENLKDRLDCPSENQNAVHMHYMIDAVLPVEEKVENLEDHLDSPSENQNAVHMHNKLDAALPAIPVKVKVENLEDGLDCPNENQNALHILSYYSKLAVKSEMVVSNIFSEDEADHLPLIQRMKLLFPKKSSNLDDARDVKRSMTNASSAFQCNPAIPEVHKPQGISCRRKRKKTATNLVETALEEDAPELLKVLMDKGIVIEEMKLYGDMGSADALDEKFDEDSFRDLETVISKLFNQPSSLLKFAPERCTKGSKRSYCLACLISLVEQTRYLRLRKWPVQWGWCRDLQSFIFVFERHNRIVVERPEYGYATYFFELVDSLTVDWQIKRLVTAMKLSSCGRATLIENKSLMVGEDLTEGEARVLEEYGWTPNSGLGSMLNYCDRVFHDRNRERDGSEWRSKIGKLLMDGYNGGTIVLANLPKKVIEYNNDHIPEIKLEL